MEPEEVDKIFKERFTGLPAVPSADAWMRLQQKMEPPKKERSMWVYYAAASVSLLLITAFLFLLNTHQAIKTNPVAQVAKPKIEKPQPDEPPLLEPVTPQITDAQEPTIAQIQKIAPTVKLKNNTLSKGQEIKETNTATIALNKKPRFKESLIKNKVVATTKAAIATTNTPAPEQATEVALNQGITPDNNVLAASLVEITVKRENTTENENSEFKENLTRKTNLLKNIYKQARNFKNGEQVELASLGINTEKINSEKKELKDKINKVISL